MSRRVSCFLAAALLVGTGCSHLPRRGSADGGPFYVPANARGTVTWPEQIRRIAVLPADGRATSLPEDFIVTYDASWRDALQGTQRAEFVPVTRPQLARWAGAPSIDSTAALPPQLFDHLAAATGADAVLFLDLTSCTAYPPLALGLRTKLVDLRTGAIVWACDERFDAGVPAVANAARRFSRTHVNRSSGSPEATVLQSPARFGAYALDAVASTLPPR